MKTPYRASFCVPALARQLTCVSVALLIGPSPLAQTSGEARSTGPPRFVSPAEEETGPDPWHTWGRTPSRIGSTTTIGPQTPTIEWSVQIDEHWSEALIGSSSSMDAYGRIFQGRLAGVTAVDSISQDVIWRADGIDTVSSAPAVFDGRVFWGVTTAGNFFCSDAATGNELWRFHSSIGFNVSPVVDNQGIVYFNDRGANIYALLAVNGDEIWRVRFDDLCFCPLAMRPNELLISGRDTDLAGLKPASKGEPWVVDWVFPTGREVVGTPVVTENTVYFASSDRRLYAVDPVDGSEIWSFDTERVNVGSVALGHDGTIYTATEGGLGVLYAVSPRGDELWSLELAGRSSASPVVDGNGVIYICTRRSSPRGGWLQAIRPDGTELWTKVMPDNMSASPMLAPDGTLYAVCRDKNLYAFRDPAGDLDHDGDIDLADLATLGECMTGPRIWGDAALTPPGCELLDFDRDWDVDVADFAQIQIELANQP